MASITSKKGTCEPVPRNSVTANKITLQGAAKAGQMRFWISFPFRDDFMGFVRLGFMHLHEL
jgi:hypothetical protein